jgi:hypothetical protein
MYFDKTRNAGAGDFYNLASAIVAAPPMTLFCLYRNLNTDSSEADFQFILGVGQSGSASDGVALNKEAVGSFDDMPGFGNGGDSELENAAARTGMWGGVAASYHALTTTRSCAALFSPDAAGGQWWEDSSVGVALGAGWDRTRIGRAAHGVGGQSGVLGEAIFLAAWNVQLPLIALKALAMGQHPLGIGLQSMVAFWEMLGGYNRSFVGAPATLTRNGEPRSCTRPGNRNIKRHVWQPVIGRPALATVVGGRPAVR